MAFDICEVPLIVTEGNKDFSARDRTRTWSLSSSIIRRLLLTEENVSYFDELINF